MRFTIAEVQTFVSDLKQAKQFYGTILELPLISETDEWLVYNGGTAQIIIMAGAQPGTLKREYGMECASVMCLFSADIERDYADLKAKGVMFFSEVNTVPEGKYVAFQDPEGNLLELIQK